MKLLFEKRAIEIQRQSCRPAQNVGISHADRPAVLAAILPRPVRHADCTPACPLLIFLRKCIELFTVLFGSQQLQMFQRVFLIWGSLVVS